MTVTLDYDKLKEIYFRDRNGLDPMTNAPKSKPQIARERSREFQDELQKSGVFDLPSEEYAEVEREIIKEFGLPVFEVDSKVKTSDRFRSYDSNGVEVETMSKHATTRQQQREGSVTMLDTITILSGNKRVIEGESYDHMGFVPSSGRSTTSNNISGTFYEVEEGGKKYILREVNIEKFDSAGNVNFPENSLYVVPDRSSAGDLTEDRDILICRLDISKFAHDNRVFMGDGAEGVLSEKAERYHFHFSDMLINLLASEYGQGSDGNVSIPQNNGKNITAYDGIDIPHLSKYLKALDGKASPELSGVDLNQNFGLPFRFMQEKGCFPKCDFSQFFKDFGTVLDRYPDLDKARQDYLSASKSEDCFENYYVALDFFAKLDEYSFVNRDSFTQIERNEVNHLVNTASTYIFKGMIGTLDSTMEQLDTEEKVETEEVVIDKAATVEPLTVAEINAEANRVVSVAEGELYAESTAESTTLEGIKVKENNGEEK